jgi:hypothetical protein
MPTQEERLSAVEFDLKQFRTETIRAYQDMAFEMTMVKGLTEDSIKRLATLNTTVEKRFDQLETKFDEHTALLTQILARLPENPPQDE